jgi:hypothetical protein
MSVGESVIFALVALAALAIIFRRKIRIRVGKGGLSIDVGGPASVSRASYSPSSN